MKKSHFLLAGLTQQHKDFLRKYAQKQLGSKSRTKAILHIIEEKMRAEASSGGGSTLRFEEPSSIKKNKKRIQFSILESDFDNLVKISNETDSSIQHYLRCLVRSVLYGKYELLGFELEVLKRSNYELYRIGVNINQIAKALNADENSEEVKVKMLEKIHEHISEHTSRVEKILKDNLERY